MRVIRRAVAIQMIPSRGQKLEESYWQSKNLSNEGKTLEHIHAGLLKLFHLMQMAFGNRERQRFGLLFTKTLFSSTKSGFCSTRSLQFNVLLDEDFKAVSVPAKLARKKQPRRLLGEHTEEAVLSPQSSSKRPKNFQLPNTGQFSVFYVYTDGGGKVTILHPYRSLFTSCSGRVLIPKKLFIPVWVSSCLSL